MPAYLLGLDVGTTSCKAGLWSTSGALLALATAPHPVERPHPGWAEQDPELYWQAAAECLRHVIETGGVPATSIAGLGACGQAPSLVVLDGQLRPARPAILWQDTRARAEAAELARDPGPGVLADWLALKWPLDASFPPARLLWLRRHEPEVLERGQALLQPKDYVNFRLTGTLACDSWSSRGLVNQVSREAPAALYARLGVRRELVPPCSLPHAVIGYVSEQAAAETGLSAGTPVVAGWSDAMAAMLGTGGFAAPGLACDIAGTSEVVGITVRAAQLPADPAPLMAAPLLDTGLAALYGPTQSSGAAVEWVLRLGWTDERPGTNEKRSQRTGRELPLVTRPLSAALDRALAAAADVPPGADGLVFLPYLEGERAPLWDPMARGALVGVTGRHERAHITRAVLEGVAFSVRHILDYARLRSGATPTAVRLGGGGARIEVWNQIKADVLQLPLLACQTTETGVLGAAMLAGLAIGQFADVAAASLAMVQPGDEVRPRAEHAPVYDAAYLVYRELYPRLRGLLTSDSNRPTRNQKEPRRASPDC